VIPPIQKGVKLVFSVGAQAEEIAEYSGGTNALEQLRAGGTTYRKNQASPRLGDAKHSLALLYVVAGQASFDAYRRAVWRK